MEQIRNLSHWFISASIDRQSNLDLCAGGVLFQTHIVIISLPPAFSKEGTCCPLSPAQDTGLAIDLMSAEEKLLIMRNDDFTVHM